MVPKLGEKWGTECLNTRFPLPGVCGIHREADLICFLCLRTPTYVTAKPLSIKQQNMTVYLSLLIFDIFICVGTTLRHLIIGSTSSILISSRSRGRPRFDSSPESINFIYSVFYANEDPTKNKLSTYIAGIPNLFLIKDHFCIILGSRDHYACRYNKN